MDRLGKFLLGAAAVAVAVSVTALIVLVVVSNNHKATTCERKECTPTEELTYSPNYKAMKNLFSAKGGLVANMVGHVEYYNYSYAAKDPAAYLVLDMTEVSLSNSTDGTRNITIEGPCLSFDIGYSELPATSPTTNRSYHIKHFIMNAKCVNKPAPTNPANCSNSGNLVDTFNFKMDANSRFSCKKEAGLLISCLPSGGEEDFLHIRLNLSSFEFEMGVDGDRAKKGEFRKPVWEQSCETGDY